MLYSSYAQLWHNLDHSPINVVLKVLYDDGDVEVLRLARERWELIETFTKPTKVLVSFCRTCLLLLTVLPTASVKLLIGP